MAIKTQSAQEFRNSKNVEIGSPGIKRNLKRYNGLNSLVEFVWNGFEAGADRVDINYLEDELGGVTKLTVSDNGSGIPLADLDRKFTPVLHSNKILDPSSIEDGPSARRGKDGVGRLTFFKFAERAEWTTTYSDGGEVKSYRIEIGASSLNRYQPTSETIVDLPTGTSVDFINATLFRDHTLQDVEEHLIQEFAWFLELRCPKEKNIFINGKILSWQSMISDEKDFEEIIEGHTFHVRYVLWAKKLHREYSRYYFVDSENKEKSNKTTALNNKGDNFYHSVYIKSEYFTPFASLSLREDGDQLTLSDFEGEKQEIFKSLISMVDNFLRQRRQPFLRQRSIKYTDDLQSQNVFPPFSSDSWDQYRKHELEEVVREIYQAEPRIFSDLNIHQKKTMINLFLLVMESSQRESLLDVVDHIVNLNSKDREELSKLLISTRMANIVSTVKLVNDRVVAVEELKKMVFNKNFDANERDHLQTHIENHYWLFGEQYHLVTKAEPDFEEALKRFTHLLTGKSVKRKIDHPDKEKEMDIFAVRRLPATDLIQNVVVELKHPDIKIGVKELTQVKTYMNVILDQPEFNASNMSWNFFLIGTEYKAEITREMKNAKEHGERHLVFKLDDPEYKIYVLSWSELFTHFELRHKFILDKLDIEKEKISGKTNADEILMDTYLNTASMLNGNTIALAPKTPAVA